MRHPLSELDLLCLLQVKLDIGGFAIKNEDLQNTQKTTNYQQNLVTICLVKVSKTVPWALETFAKRLWTLPHFG